MRKVTTLILKIMAGIIGSVLLLAILAILLLRLPAVQNYVTQKVVSIVSSKTHTHIELKKVYIAFPKSVVIENLFAEDVAHDTLLYLGKLKVDVDMLGLLKKKVSINSLYLNDVNANIKRNVADSTFNFAFLIKAFSSPDPKKPKPESKTDTAAAPWQINVSKLELVNIRGGYEDGLTGTSIKGNVGHLNLKMNGINLQHLGFDANELVLSDASATMIITDNTTTKESIDTVRSLLPSIAVTNATLKNVSFSFENPGSGQKLLAHAGHLLIHPDTIDLNRQLIKVKALQMDSSYCTLAFRRNNSSDNETNSTSIEAGEPQGWRVEAGSAELKKVNFAYDITNAPKLAAGVDYNHLHLKDVSLDIKNAMYSTKLTKGDIQQLSVAEQSGFVLTDMRGQGIFDEHHIEVTGLSLTTPHTHITNHLAIRYASLNNIGTDIGALGIEADLQNTTVGLRDVLLFAPRLKDQPPFNGSSKIIAVNGKIRGTIKDVTLTGLEMKTGNATALALDGHITGLPDAVHSRYDVHIKNLSTTNEDLLALFGKNLPASIHIPATVQLSGSVKGALTDAATQLNLKTNKGDIVIDASFKMLNGDTEYVAKMVAEKLDIGYFLKDTSLLGEFTGAVNVKGKNLSPATLQANVDAQIQSVAFRKYNYQNISLTATANGKAYAADVSVKDENIQLDLKGDVSLVKDSESAHINLKLTGADLQQLKLIDSKAKVGGDVTVELDGPLKELNGYSTINNVTVLKNDETYRVGSLLALSVNNKEHSTIKTKTSIANIDYKGSVQPAGLQTALTTFVNRYFHTREPKDTVRVIDTMQNFYLQVSILPHPVLNALVPGLEQFNGADITAEFDNKKQNLDLVTAVPGINYKGNKLDNLQLEVHADKNEMAYSVAFDRLQSGNFLRLAETSLEGSLENDSLDFALKVHDVDSANKLIISGTVTQLVNNNYVLRLDENDLVFQNQKWKLPEGNFVSFQPEGFYVHQLNLNNGEQNLSINSTKDEPAAPLKIEFKQFQLGTLSQIIENDTSLVRGLLNGTVELRNLQQALAFVSDLKMDSVSFRQNPIGTIQVKADNLSADKYTAEVSITSSDNDVKIHGYYAPNGNTNQLNFKADINKLQLRSVEGFTGGQIRQSDGYLTASLEVTGTGAKPVINGDVNFKNATTNVAYINNVLKLKDEHIKVDSKGVYFKNFNIQDEQGQNAVINGTVYTTDFRKMKFDMSFTTKHFTVMNTSIEDNPLYFGHVILNSNLTIKGDESLPVIRGNAKLLGGSTFNVVVPSSKINVDRGDGVVVLVDTSVKNNIMSNPDTIPVAVGFKGIDMAMNLEIDKGTSLKVIVDKTSGDSLVVKGDGVLSFAMDETGKQTLTGTYTLSDGSYKASFQGVIKRDFKIKEGGTITWNGSPTDANVDITAIYATRTSPADLLSAELAGVSSSDRNVYRQLLHFMVLMNMKGELLKPAITFQLDMSDQDKGAFSGTVYAKINSLNDDPGELNRQVFALLVLGSFIPTGAAGSSDANPVSTFARNSVNQILSDQLNNLSGRFIKGVDLNFGIESNDQYSTTGVSQQTQVSVGLKKEFFKNRLSVQVGTSLNVEDNTGAIVQNGSGNITGDFVLEYKLTKDGEYRFKAFRVNQYESIIDGLLYKTGIGLIFTKNYDTPKELFSRKRKTKDSDTKTNDTP